MLNPTRLIRPAPSATDMIRMDHTHVFATFHRFKPDTPPNIKKGLVNTACTALEIHARLEEEIFYPALRSISNSEVVQKSVPEHNEMRRLIGNLRNMEPGQDGYDATFMDLMREVIHHVADEETVLLPLAETRLHDELKELGARMLQRRMALTLPRSAEIAVNMVRATSPGHLALAGAALLGGLLAWRYCSIGLKDRRD